VGSNGVYALTGTGNLLLLRSTGRTVDRSINLQVRLCAAPPQSLFPSTARFYSHAQSSIRLSLLTNSTGAGGLWTCSFSEAGGLRMCTRSGPRVRQQVAPVQGQPAILEFRRCAALHQAI
jgi:hypothetical protein